MVYLRVMGRKIFLSARTENPGRRTRGRRRPRPAARGHQAMSSFGFTSLPLQFGGHLTQNVHDGRQAALNRQRQMLGLHEGAQQRGIGL